MRPLYLVVAKCLCEEAIQRQFEELFSTVQLKLGVQVVAIQTVPVDPICLDSLLTRSLLGRATRSLDQPSEGPTPARALALVAGRSARCFCPAHPGRARSTPPRDTRTRPARHTHPASLRRGGTTAPVRDTAGRAVCRFPPGSSRRGGRRSAGYPRQPQRKAAVARHSPPDQAPQAMPRGPALWCPSPRPSHRPAPPPAPWRGRHRAPPPEPPPQDPVR